MGEATVARVRERFTLEAQGDAYLDRYVELRGELLGAQAKGGRNRLCCPKWEFDRARPTT